jgi:hypothetical protein
MLHHFKRHEGVFNPEEVVSWSLLSMMYGKLFAYSLASIPMAPRLVMVRLVEKVGHDATFVGFLAGYGLGTPIHPHGLGTPIHPRGPLPRVAPRSI